MTVANDHIDIDAIAEAVPQEKPVQPPDYRHHFLQGLESCRVAVNVPNSERDNSVFGYLLEAISGPTGDGDEGSVSVVHQSDALKSSRQHARTEQEEGTTSAAYGPELLEAYSVFERTLNAVKVVQRGDIKSPNTSTALPHSSDEAIRLASSSTDKSMKYMVETETARNGVQNCMPSADENIDKVKEDKQVDLCSDGGKTYCKRGNNDEQHNMSADQEKDRKKGEEDGQYNMSFPREGDEDAETSWNEISDAPESGIQRSMKEKKKTLSPVKKQSQQSKTIAKKTKVLKEDVNTAGLVHEPVKSTSVLPLLPKKKPATWVGNKTFVSPVPAPLNSPSSTVPHRRVVGLSRRHRPPPLHPYLLGS
nr:hypothetical protein PHYPA_018174 [Physcomitrium patens]